MIRFVSRRDLTGHCEALWTVPRRETEGCAELRLLTFWSSQERGGVGINHNYSECCRHLQCNTTSLSCPRGKIRFVKRFDCVHACSDLLVMFYFCQMNVVIRALVLLYYYTRTWFI